jgi:hypothetical protein
MNANELADELEESATRVEDAFTGAKRRKLAAAIIRQQQEEIEYWKEKFNKAMELNK